ncbi:MAG: hypothetical protein HRU19_17625 [Pseudobacteriovorax sp.]|nr:hypothetical protein [Pseudobacteriovorax sp.]
MKFFFVPKTAKTRFGLGVLPIIVLVLLSSSCGEPFNILGFIADPAYNQNAIDLQSQAEAKYNKGEYEEALSYASQARDLAPESEAVAVTLSSIHMALAGIDSFQLVTKLISQNDDETALQGSTAADTLSGLSGLIGIDTNDSSGFILEGNRSGNIEGAPTTGVFKDLPVLLPKDATSARNEGGQVLYHINQAIEVLCPFVGDEVKILTEGSADIRHGSEDCSSRGEVKLKPKSYFNWAFAHLSEAILFHSVVLYAPEGGDANLQRRADLLGQPESVASTSEYVSAVTELAEVTDIIFPTDTTSAANSMLLAIFNDLDATSRGFANISGIPDSISASIIESLAGLKSQRDSISGQNTDKNSSNEALKEQLTSGLAGSLGTQIQEKVASGELQGEELTDARGAYSSISSVAIEGCSL